MATKRVNSTNPFPISPEDLPADGTPVSFTQTFAKNVGVGKTDEDSMPTADQYEDCEWDVQRQTSEGWEFVGRTEVRPSDLELHGDFGIGKYAIAPVDPRNGKIVTRLREVRRIAAATNNNVLPFPAREGEGTAQPQQTPIGGEDMPAWMRWQMEQAASERLEAGKRADKAEAQQKTFQEQMALKEFEREERREREERQRRIEAKDDAKNRIEMITMLVGAAAPVLTALLKKDPPPPQRDTTDMLLQELRAARSERSPATNGMQDSLQTLVLLDKLAESRSARDRGFEKDDDDDDDDLDVKKMIVGMLPSLLNRGGGGGNTGGAQQSAPQIPDSMVNDMLDKALQDPEIISRIAMRNPNGIAKAFKSALKSNPLLERTMIDALDDGDDDANE